MLTQIYTYFTSETIYLWLNYGVIPIWLSLIFFPNSKLNKIFLTSIFLPIIFGAIYIYIFYQLMFLNENILDSVSIYLSLEKLMDLFSNELFLLIFWIHFLAINLFVGSWVSRDAAKYNMPKIFSAISLVLIYFTGPLGLVVYWFVRIFFAKKISLYD
tara:strand:+ start:230 stop:703 length:474 start_codon:yes stop_codon:yes gene_type:complete